MFQAAHRYRCTPSHSQSCKSNTPLAFSAGGDRWGELTAPSGVVTMSIHKLTAGSGYDYLTRQVAALDATEKGQVGLASYYTERGETRPASGLAPDSPGSMASTRAMRSRPSRCKPYSGQGCIRLLPNGNSSCTGRT